MVKTNIANIVSETLKDKIEFNFKKDVPIDQESYDDFIDMVSDNLEYNFSEMGIKFSTDGGADKNVFIFDNYDFVLKIPKVTGKKELFIYDEVKKAGFENYFARVEPITVFKYSDKDVVAYFQTKIDFSGRGWEWESWLEKDEEKKERIILYSNDLMKRRVKLEDGSFSPLIKDRTLAYYISANISEEIRNDFVNFLIEKKVNDLNSNNFWIGKDGHLTIFDYSGYDDSYKYSEDYDDEDDEYCSY